MMFTAFLKKWLGNSTKGRNIKCARYRPEIVVLEELITPTVKYWAGDAGWQLVGRSKLED
jgi:hypothetical protein